MTKKRWRRRGRHSRKGPPRIACLLMEARYVLVAGKL
jgi:hypothetical protein